MKEHTATEERTRARGDHDSKREFNSEAKGNGSGVLNVHQDLRRRIPTAGDRRRSNGCGPREAGKAFPLAVISGQAQRDPESTPGAIGNEG